MSATKYSTGGLERSTWSETPIRLQLAVFAVTLVSGAALITWIKASTWRQAGRLHQEFASIESDRFSLGAQARSDIGRLNDSLFYYCVGRNNADRDAFVAASQQLKQRLDGRRNILSTEAERASLSRLEAACESYLGAANEMLAQSEPLTGSASASELHKKIEVESKPVVAASESLIRAQNAAFASLLHDAEQTLNGLQDLLKLTLALLLTIGLALAVIVYRGMISPLRKSLSQSRAIIGRQEKLASLGVLAAGVAHEIRNPLQAIKFRLFSLKESLPQVADNEDANVIKGEIDRLDRVVKDFLQFARPSEPELARLPADRVLNQVCNLLKSDLEKRGIQLKAEQAGAAWVEADSHQIEQVLINLVQNSAESIGQNGAVTLRAHEETASLRGRARPAVVLEVTDTGQGIPPEVERRLFDPFFTTKEDGTGLGLAIASRIVDKHGGLLRYRTKLNRGTTFEIVLPKTANYAS